MNCICSIVYKYLMPVMAMVDIGIQRTGIISELFVQDVIPVSKGLTKSTIALTDMWYLL